jgi:hypothetical protein
MQAAGRRENTATVTKYKIIETAPRALHFQGGKTSVLLVVTMIRIGSYCLFAAHFSNAGG